MNSGWEVVYFLGGKGVVTYTLIQEERVTRRSTIWRRCGTDWKIVYDQGTIVEAD